MPPLEENEKGPYTARKHWFILAGEAVFIGILAVLPGLLLFAPHLLPAEVLATIKEMLHFEGSSLLSICFFWSLELLLLCIFFFLFWTDYYLDVWFITDIRVIAIEQRGLFNRSTSTFRLDMIQDATVKVPGILATILGFGTVSVRTASEDSFTFRGVAYPNRLKERIMSEHSRVQEGKQEASIKSE